MGIWLDFSGPPPSIAALKAVRVNGQPVEGLLRYIGLGSEAKQIHRAEADAYYRAGFRYGLVAELGTGDAWVPLDDYATGRARAQVALDDMRREAPKAEFICCAADAHASSAAQIGDAVQYAAGFQSVLGFDFSGFYGFVETSRAVHAAGLCRVHWRCGSEPSAADKAWVTFWQRNRPPQVVVVDGTTCDINERYAPPPAPPQPHQEEEDDVIKFARTNADPTVWVGNGVTRNPIKSQQVATGCAQMFGIPVDANGWPPVTFVDDLDVIGLAPMNAPGDVDEAALAAELAARGIGGITAAELKEVLSTVRLVPGN